MSKFERELFAQAYKISLKNAEQWIKDAKLLMEHSSFGHANALLRFASEEIGKALISWYVSEELFPSNSKPVRDVFRNHVTKNQVILGILIGLQWAESRRKGQIEVTREPTDKEIEKAWNLFKDMTFGMEKQRQKGIYVDLDLKNKKIASPETITEEEVKVILQGTEVLFRYVSGIPERFSDQDKERFREFFKSLPKEVWKTGQIPIE